MEIDVALIARMYLEDKLSAAQIGERVQLSTGKVRYILTRNGIPKRSLNEAITQVNITRFHKVPFRLRPNLSVGENDLKVTGIMLYWGEGAKTGGSLKLANSNPELIKAFLLFLRNICGVDEERIKLLIHMYPDQNWEFLKKFWGSVTGIPPENLYKPQVLKGKKGTYKNKSVYGTATIHYSDKKLLKLVIDWIDEYKDRFLNPEIIICRSSSMAEQSLCKRKIGGSSPLSGSGMG